MAAPAQSWSTLFAAYLDPLGAVVPQGYAVTKNGDGSAYVLATSANLTASTSGTIDGIQLAIDGSAGANVPIQRDAKVESGVVPWLGSGVVEQCVVDANGKPQRASVASGSVIGLVDKEGAIQLNLAGSVAVAGATIAGDVIGTLAASTVVAIRNATIPTLAGNIGKALVLSTLGAFAFAAFGTATSGYDTADHIGGGQEVLAATGSAGLFNVRGSAAVTWGNAPATSGSAMRMRAPATNDLAADWQIARRNGAGANDVMILGAASDGATTESIFIGSAQTGTPNTLVKISSSAEFQVRTGSTTVNNPALDVTTTVAKWGPGDAVGMPIAFGSTPATTGTARFPSATDATGYSLLKVRNSANTGDRNAVGMYLVGGVNTGFMYGDAIATAQVNLYSPNVDLVAVGGATMASFTPSLMTFGPAVAAGIPLAFGTTPATAGLGLRVPSATTAGGTYTVIAARNDANSANRNVLGLYTQSGDIGIWLGDTANGIAEIDLSATGAAVSTLAGSGTRMVTCTAAGLLGSQAIPSAGTPGGSNTQIQYNNAGAFGGTAEFTYSASRLNVSASGAIALGSAPASTGAERFSNAQGIYWRNFANTADCFGVGVDASNFLILGDTTNSGEVRVTPATTVRLMPGGATKLAITTSLMSMSVPIDMGSNYIQAGTNPALSGILRLGNNTAIVFRDSGNATDYPAMTLDNFNGLTVGNSGPITKIIGSGIYCQMISGTTKFSVETSLLTCNVLLATGSGVNFSIGDTAPNFNSGTNITKHTDGTAPSAKPSGGCQVWSNGGQFTIWNSNTATGKEGHISIGDVRTAAAGANDHRLMITYVDPSGTTTAGWVQLIH